jgi:5-methylcytosine-specific restriction protein A
VGKLTNLKPALATLRPSVAFMPQGQQETDRFRNAQHWRKWYSTKQWRQLRWSVLVRDRFTCAICGNLEAQTAKLVADHKQPHRGDERLFWDASNLQTLCASCHSGAKQRAEQAGG